MEWSRLAPVSFLYYFYIIYLMKSRMEVIYYHAIKSINHKWLTDFLMLRNDVHYNVAYKITKVWQFYAQNAIFSLI